MVKKILPFFVVIVFAVISGVGLLHEGLPPTHDGEYHVIRFYEFDKVLRSGIWYPRWAPDLNNGYGIPLFNYVYPFPNYFSSLLRLFGISFIDAFKLNMFFASIIGAVFFYLWSKRFWGEAGGVIASIFYTFSPYQFLDKYIRGSVGEVWAMAFFPAFLWSVGKFIENRSAKYLVLSSIFLALIIFSHNILGLIFFIFGIFYIAFLIIQTKEKRYLMLNTLYLTFLSLSLSSIFWLPALFEKELVSGLQIYNIAENFPDLYQLLIPSWGSGFSEGDLQNQMSFQIGIVNLIAVPLSVLVLFKNLKKKETKGVLLFFLLWFVLVFFLMLKISLPSWKAIPFMNFFQFPWRLLSLEILITSFLAGSMVHFLRKRRILIKLPIFALIFFFPVLITFSYAKPAYYHYRDDNYYIKRSNFIDGTNSPGNLFNTVWVTNKLEKRGKRIELLGEGKILKENMKPQKYEFSVRSDKDIKIKVNTAYFPGWTASAGDKEINILNQNGIMYFSVKKGINNIIIVFGDTPIRKLATLFFVLSILIMFIIFVKDYIIKTIK